MNFGNGTAATYGIVAYGALYGVYGQSQRKGTSSSFGAGVEGYDNNGTANDDFNIGVNGSSVYGTAVLGEADGSPSLGYVGTDPIGVYAVGNKTGSGNVAFGLVAESDTFALDAENTTDNSYTELSSHGFLLVGGNTTDGNVVNLDTSGNLSIAGSLYTGNGGPYIRTRGASGVSTIAYADRMTTPEMEDVGEAKLVDGTSFVRIDSALSDDIDKRNAYHVFLTPEGDCNGLFVTQKGPQGFAVRELRGGRSSIAFEYRIVAKPLDENGQRLAIAPAFKQSPPLGSVLHAKRRHLPLPVSPQERLRKALGPQGYAAALARLTSR